MSQPKRLLCSFDSPQIREGDEMIIKGMHKGEKKTFNVRFTHCDAHFEHPGIDGGNAVVIFFDVISAAKEGRDAK